MTGYAITYRLVKGSNITAAEYDASLHNLDDRVTVVEGLATAPVTPTAIDVSAGKLYFHFSNGLLIGPVDFPNPFRFKGEWTPATGYVVGDLITAAGATYEVIFAHTSAGSFSAGANDGLGNDFYGLFLASPAAVLPTGGTTGQALVKTDNADFNGHWSSSVVPAGGAGGQLLAKSSGTDFATDWIDAPNGLPPGGTTGQALTKASGADDDVHWSTVSALLSALGDVVLTSPNTLDLLQFDGTHWINAARTAPSNRHSPVSALGTSGTVWLDVTVADIFTITPTGDVTLGVSFLEAGAQVTIIVLTSGTTSRTITFNPAASFKTTGTLATGTVSGKKFSITFASDGVDLVEVARTVAM